MDIVTAPEAVGKNPPELVKLSDRSWGYNQPMEVSADGTFATIDKQVPIPPSFLPGLKIEDPLPGQIPNVSCSNKSNPIMMASIGSGRYVVVSQYKGMTLIHLRQYVTDVNSGKSYATKKGIGLTVKQWETVKKLSKEIDTAVKMYELQQK